MEDSDVETNRDEKGKSLLEVLLLCGGISQELMGLGLPGVSHTPLNSQQLTVMPFALPSSSQPHWSLKRGCSTYSLSIHLSVDIQVASMSY